MKSILALMLLTLSGPTMALLTDMIGVLVDEFHNDYIPSYCVPPDAINQQNNYTFYDLSSSCAGSYCDSACVMYVTEMGERNFTIDKQQEFHEALMNQSTLDGRFSAYSNDYWTASFGGSLGLQWIITAMHHRESVNIWLNSFPSYLHDYDSWTPSGVYFVAEYNGTTPDIVYLDYYR